MTRSRLKLVNAHGLVLTPGLGRIMVLLNSSPITATFCGIFKGRFSSYMPDSINTEICVFLVISPYAIFSPFTKLPYTMSTSKSSSFGEPGEVISSSPECARICANAPEVSPKRYSPSLISLPRIATGSLVNILPVKSVRNPLVKIKNLGKSTTQVGILL